MSQPKIALAMIVKHDESVLLAKCLNSVAGYVDKTFLYINYPKGVEPDGTVQNVADMFQAETVVKEWTNFGDARNKNFAMVPEEYDFILWLDTDDTVTNPEKLRQVAAATPKHISGIYMAYNYQVDEFGNPTVQHYVARMVRNDGTFAWSKKILHETLEPIRHAGKAMNDEVVVVHHADELRRDRSLMRNVEMLEKELEGEGDSPDPRTLYYLGTTLIDMGRTDESKELLSKYLQNSGWAEERAQAWVHLGNIFYNENNREEALACYTHAVVENPKDPSPCVELAKLEMHAELWDKAIEWLTMALAKNPEPMSTTMFSAETRYRAHMLLADCYMAQGGPSLDKALETAQKALEMRPDDTTQHYYEGIEAIINQRDMAKGAVLALRELEKQKVPSKRLIGYIESLPESLQDNPSILRFRKRHSIPKKWPNKSVVIFTGNSVIGEWDPDTLSKGVGGSEEAVIRLSKQLKNKGYQVWVYGSPGAKAGNFDGVEWRNYWELNLADTFDIFVGWRMPWFFDIKMTARKKYLWLHDVMDKEEFTKERLDNLDKVIVLSKYHRSVYPMIPDEKILLSANGIDDEESKAVDGKFKRDPHQVIYMSSHVRGLQMLYKIWPEVIKEVPDAKLDIYYGWNSYDQVNRGNPERQAWKEMMVNEAKKLKNVTDHGKVSQLKIVEEIAKSGVWAYPCPFPEISCITAMKAQAGGAVPVTSDFAALAETVKFGTKLHMNEAAPGKGYGEWNENELRDYTYALIQMLKNPDEQEKIRKEMVPAIRDNNSWTAVAEGWVDDFSKN